MSATVARVLVVAGALMQPHWLPPAEVRARLPRLSALAGLAGVPADLPADTDALPRELAHDRWLRCQVDETRGPGDAPLAPGAMTAVRQLARSGEQPLPRSGEHPPARSDAKLTGWLLEPSHFHLARDHLVLVAGAARGLALDDARQLLAAIGPLLAEDSLAATVLNPTQWLLASPIPLQLTCASSEAAAGRNVEGYLPRGADERRYRRLLNAIQMTWHEHPVNQGRESRGDLPVNSVWISGPVACEVLAAWNQALARGRYTLDDRLLDARLRDDRAAWLDALQAMDEVLSETLTTAGGASILLCGDNEARWLRRGRGGSIAWQLAIDAVMAQTGRAWRSLLAGRGTSQTEADPLVRLFTEA